MVRDYKFRSHSPGQTLAYWNNVLAGERININLYRDNVDLKMDNTIDYEVCCWRTLLHAVLEDSELKDASDEVIGELIELFRRLRQFPEIDPDLIPKNSLLREFIGDDTFPPEV
jgi:uridine kinase